MNRLMRTTSAILLMAVLWTAGCHSHDKKTIERDRVIIHDGDDHGYYHHHND